MWLEVTDDEKIIYHVDEGEAVPKVDMIDGVVIHAEELPFGDQTGILYTLSTINNNNKRLHVSLETSIEWSKLTPIIKHYIDEYYDVVANMHKQKSEVWTDVLCGE